MPKERIMKHKTETQIAKLIMNFPIVGLIRFAHRSGNGKLPKIDVHIQRADPGTMHLQANNCRYKNRSYLCGENNLRGTRIEYMVAVDCSGKPMTYLEWERDDFEKMSKDIFEIASPEEVNYLVWVSAINWYTPSSEEREEETGGNPFDQFVDTEVDIIIFQQSKDQTFSELIKTADKQKEKSENAYKFLPEVMPEFPGIHKGLEDGGKIHAFCSGGGLRVVYMRRNGSDDNMAYGEHPHIEDALNHLEEDFLAGGRKYKDVYGGLYPHYLTGNSIATSNLDNWILRRRTFDCFQVRDDEIHFLLSGYKKCKIPKDIYNKVIRTLKPMQWKHRGFIFLLEPANIGTCTGVSVKVIASPINGKNLDPRWYNFVKLGKGKTFWEAVKKAFEAEEVEV
jgi:hypothetical protein